MNRVIQPSVAKRLAFAKWARLQGYNRHSSATWNVPEGVDVPESLMAGAQVGGKPFAPDAPKRTRVRKTKDRGPVSEPAAPVEPEPEVEIEKDPEPETFRGFPQRQNTQEDD